MADKWYTVAGVAALKGTTYPTVRNAIKEGRLVPTIANAGLTGAREVELISEKHLKDSNWEPIHKARLTDEQRIERAAKLFGGIEQMKAALSKEGK